jgi:hypothetical protein
MIFNFVKFIATEKIRQHVFCPSSFLLFLDPGFKMEKSWIRAKHPGYATLPTPC